MLCILGTGARGSGQTGKDSPTCSSVDSTLAEFTGSRQEPNGSKQHPFDALKHSSFDETCFFLFPPLFHVNVSHCCLSPQPYISYYYNSKQSGQRKSIYKLSKSKQQTPVASPSLQTGCCFLTVTEKQSYVISLMAPPPALTQQQETGDMQTYKSGTVWGESPF